MKRLILGAAGENDEAQPDLSKLSRDELKQLEAILARAYDKPSSTGAGPAEPF